LHTGSYFIGLSDFSFEDETIWFGIGQTFFFSRLRDFLRDVDEDFFAEEISRSSDLE
jgi:hypothetical protein